eukprot:8551973-Alexandrium_andersonii.AAC.1
MAGGPRTPRRRPAWPRSARWWLRLPRSRRRRPSRWGRLPALRVPWGCAPRWPWPSRGPLRRPRRSAGAAAGPSPPPSGEAPPLRAAPRGPAAAGRSGPWGRPLHPHPSQQRLRTAR